MIHLPADLKFPVLVRPKLRGVRCFILNGEAMMRLDDHAVPVPNRPMSDILSGLPAFDGIIVVGSPLDAVCGAVTHEAVMSTTEVPVFTYYVVDLVTTGKYSFAERYKMLKEYARACRSNIQAVYHKPIENTQELSDFERSMTMGHYPGIVVRDPEATVGGIWSS